MAGVLKAQERGQTPVLRNGTRASSRSPSGVRAATTGECGAPLDLLPHSPVVAARTEQGLRELAAITRKNGA